MEESEQNLAIGGSDRPLQAATENEVFADAEENRRLTIQGTGRRELAEE